MAHATELGHTSSVSSFPDYFSDEAPHLVVQESLDIPDNFKESDVPTLRSRMASALGGTAVAAQLESMSDTAGWLVEEVAAEGASNGIRGDRELLDAGYGATADGKFVEYFSDSDPDWKTDPNRQDHGRGLEVLRRAGVEISYIQASDHKTLFFTIDPTATADESDEVMFDLDGIDAI